MKRLLCAIFAVAIFANGAMAAKPKFEVRHIEPLSWWVGMTTPLQLMINGDNISAYDVTIVPQGMGVEVTKIHKA
ncbi:MAG: cyclomaltodextrinase N-terminal domain-containing protein, partial [Alistipes sp.]|nr:cyclomaltodextrinase N-terminal domain-containing protein [Alistipes sp.]